ncbi:uncharacterized protein LOC131879721 isoform X5 [Tigriopus californicus]|uniref:uncharacterized protein LOC131879721 isoform X5 n=1 Tax=Tigriopus californicus TaxID=6832 RepID=UPI0027DA0C73|nr:uncharacterized protein LOC131879721 isoform X5 [Tigriopus californicus]
MFILGNVQALTSRYKRLKNSPLVTAMVMKMYALPPVQPLRGNVALPESMYQLPPIMRLSHLNNDDREPMKRVSVVVHADPRYPPYSLLCVGNLLKKAGFATKVNNHVHSALKEPVNKNLANHFDSSEWDECGDGSESCENYCLTVIWKLVGLDPYASIGFDIVKGEANILRHLVRSLSTVFHYETDDHQTLVFDSLMDDVHENVTWGSDRDCVSFLERSESFFLSGAQRSFVDFLVWSALLNKRFTIPSRRLLQWYTAGLRENGIPLQRRNSSRLSESRGGSMPRNRKKTLSCSSNHASAVIRVD